MLSLFKTNLKLPLTTQSKHGIGGRVSQRRIERLRQ